MLRMGGATPLLPLYAFREWTKNFFPYIPVLLVTPTREIYIILALSE
jgi:hypothetical protein